MRIKSLLCAAGIAALALPAMAQTPVYSLNVVGYVNVVTPVNGFTMVANPFNYGGASNPNNWLSNVVTGVPINTTKVWQWNRAGANYIQYTLRSSGWGLGSTVAFNPGTGFFLNNTGVTPMTNTFVGEVPQGTNTFAYGTGFNLISFMSPISGRVETDLKLPVVNNDKVWQWHPESKTYVQYTRRAAAWGSGLEPVVGTNSFAGPAEGFFLQTTVPNTWTNVFNVQ